MNIYMICTLWTPFQTERDWKNSYRDSLNSPLIYALFSMYRTTLYEQDNTANSIFYIKKRQNEENRYAMKNYFFREKSFLVYNSFWK